MNRFISGFSASIFILSILATLVAIFVGGLYLIGEYIIYRFDLYGLYAIIIFLVYTVIFFSIIFGIINTIPDDDVSVSGEEQ